MSINNKRKLTTNTPTSHKKNKHNLPNNNSDDDNDDSGHSLGVADDLFDYRIDNHIYFTSNVSKASINKLSKLIGEINREYNLTKLSLMNTSSIDQNKLSPKPIYLHINSNGGSLYEGYRGMDIIRTSVIPIYTVAEGCVISAATMMFVAGKKRYMTESSYMLIHQMSVQGLGGTYEELKDSNENNKQFMEKIIDIYYKASNGKMKKKQIAEVLKHDMYWNYDTCKKYGLVDDVWTGEH